MVGGEKVMFLKRHNNVMDSLKNSLDKIKEQKI